MRHFVRARHDAARVLRHIDATRGIGAVIVDHVSAHAQDFAVIVNSDFHVPDLVAFLSGTGEMFATVLDPLDRRFQYQGRGRDDDIFRVENKFWTKAAANIRRDYSGVGFIASQQVDKHAVRHVRHLGAEPNGQPVFKLIVTRHQTAALQRHAETFVQREFFLEHMRCAGEGGIGVAIAHREFGEDIVIRICVRDRRARLSRLFRIGGRRQDVVIHFNQRCCVFCDISVVRDHDCDRLSHVADLACRKDRAIAKLLIGLARHTDREAVSGQVG